MLEFTQRDKEALNHWLQTGEFSESAMPFAQLEGYLFALVCAPSPISEDIWVAEALGGDLANLAEDKLFALMAFHNAVSDVVFEKGYRVSEQVTICQLAEDNLSQYAELHQWSMGFSIGIQNYISAIVNSNELNAELQEALAMTLGYLCFFSNLDNQTKLCASVIELLDDFTEGFASLIEASVIDANLIDNEGFED